MPDFTFTSPEGRSYTVTGPEGATKEQAFQVLQQQLASGTAKEETQGRSATDYAKFAAGNVLKGAAQQVGSIAEAGQKVVDAPEMVVNWLADKFGKGQIVKRDVQAPTTASVAPVTESGVQSALQKTAPQLMAAAEPKTSSEKYAAAALQALPTAVVGEGALAKRAVQAAASGMGAQLGGDIAGTPGALVGGLVGGSIGAPKGDTKLPAAEAEAKRAGIPLGGNKIKQAQAGTVAVAKLADRISANPDSAEELGTKLSDTLTQTVQHYDQQRSAEAARDYGVVRELAKDKPVIKYSNTVQTLDKIISENEGVHSADSQKIYRQAVAMRNDMLSGGEAQTYKIDPAMKTRRAWGQAARGTGNIFSDVDPNISRGYASRLFGAINQDFRDASTTGTPYADALAKANKRYGDLSKSIDYVRKSALAKLVGDDVVDAAFTGAKATTKAPELLADRYTRLKPSEARTVTNILRKQNPSVLEDAKAYTLRNMLEKSSSNIPGELPMNFAKFIGQFKTVEPKLKEMGFSQKDIVDIRDVVNTMGRSVSRQKPVSNEVLATAAGFIGHNPYVGIPLAVIGKALTSETGRKMLRRVSVSPSGAVRHQTVRSLIAIYGQREANDSGGSQ